MNIHKKIVTTFLVVGVVIAALNWSRIVEYVKAVDVGTSVTVSNTGPDFKGGTDVYETPASTVASPTDEGTNVVIKATSEDSNDDNYFLIVCSTDSVSAGGGDGNAPACGATEYCISTSTVDETEATCTIDTSSGFGGTTELYAWYAFVCDDVAATACSSSSQGTLSDGSESPFNINHRPTYTSFSDGGCANPGSNVTFTADNGASALDTDESDGGANDTVDLYVCKADDFTGSTCGSGGEWCNNTGVAGTNTSIACNYTVSSVWDDDTVRNAYAFVVDEHGFETASQLSDTWNACNVDPTVSSVTLNGGSDMTLTSPGPSGTDNFTLTASITDNNGCSDISAVQGYLYRSGITYSGCDTSGEADNNNCYPEISCSLDSGTDDCTSPDLDGTLDQEQDSHYAGTTNENNVWQSFTAGQNGYLTRVSIYISGFMNAGYHYLYQGEGTGGSVLDVAYFDSIPSSFDWHDFYLSTPVPITSGQKYTYHIDNLVAYGIDMTDPYAGGIYGWTSDYDMTFRTYVSTNVDYDATAAYTCTATVAYHADPTDGSSSTDSTWYDQNWLDTVKATDDNAGTGNTEVTTGVEMQSYTAFTVTSSIDYGSLAAGANSDTTNQTTVVSATGNVGLDENLSGTTMTYSSYTIPIANQKYGLTAFDYDLAGTALSASATESELNCGKTTTTGSPATADTYWGIAIPAVAGSGSYTGTNYIVAIKGEAGDW